MTLKQMHILFISTLVLDSAIFAALLLTPIDAWYSILLAILLDVFNAIVIAKFLRWLP